MSNFEEISDYKWFAKYQNLKNYHRRNLKILIALRKVCRKWRNCDYCRNGIDQHLDELLNDFEYIFRNYFKKGH